MFDIDKALTNIKPVPQQPSERLRESTRQLVFQEVRRKQTVKRSGRLAWALPVAAAMLAAFVFLFTLPPAADEVSFITIDINPSISMQVNTSGLVLAVSAENDDATVLLQSLHLTGLQFKDALNTVVRTADEQGYLKEDGHVLVACFGGAAKVTQQTVETIVAESTEREVKVLLLQSDKKAFEEAKSLNQRPGVQLLKKQASEQGIEEQDIDRIIVKMREKAGEKGNAESKPVQTNRPQSQPTAAPKEQNSNGNKNNDKAQQSGEGKGKAGDKANQNAADNPSQKDKTNDNDNGESANNGNGNGQSGNDEGSKGNGDNKDQNSENTDSNKNNKQTKGD